MFSRVGCCSVSQVVESLKGISAMDVKPVFPCDQCLAQQLWRVCRQRAVWPHITNNKQTFSRWATEEPEPDEDGELPKKAKRKGNAKKNEKKKTTKKEAALSKQPKAAKAKQAGGKRPNAGDDVASEREEPKSKQTKPAQAPLDCAYVAGEYSQVRLKFIRKRQASGWTFKEASAYWNTSKTRAKILENMPPSEKARRRFT